MNICSALILSFCCVAHATLSIADYAKLLPKNYNKYQHPSKGQNVTKVKFHMNIISLDLDESDQCLVANLFLSTKWFENRIVNKSSNDSVIMRLPNGLTSVIWMPSIFFRGAREVQMAKLPSTNSLLWMYQRNMVVYWAHYYVRIPCPLDYNKYPHDVQACQMTLESVSNTVNDVEFGWDSLPNKVSSDSLTNFHLLKTQFTAFVETYSSGGYSCLQTRLVFKRKSASALINIYFPCWILVSISWMSCMIKVSDLRSKIWLALFISGSLLFLHAKISVASDDIVAVDCYFLFCWLQTFSLLVFNCFIFRMRSDDEVV